MFKNPAGLAPLAPDLDMKKWQLSSLFHHLKQNCRLNGALDSQRFSTLPGLFSLMAQPIINLRVSDLRTSYEKNNRISLCSESRTENCLPHHRPFSKLLFCHSHVISHIIMALEGNLCHVSSFLDHLQSVNSMPFIAKATQQWQKLI